MDFDSEKTISYWMEGAEYDISVADALLQSGKYPYALFFGHLAIEKILKALVVKETNEHAPYTHSLPVLAGKLTLKIPENIHKKLAGFMGFYFEARYPEEQKKFYDKCTKKFAKNNLDEIKSVFGWLKKKLLKN